MIPPAASAASPGAQPSRPGTGFGSWPWLAGLFAVGLLSRWATRTQLVQAWDAGNFVLALAGFDLDHHVPHMPGVFWCLIALGRLLRPLTGGDGVAALELVNALAAAAALPCGWWLGRSFGGLRVGAWLVGLLFSAPLLWFYASQPLSYGVELGWVVAIGGCAWGVAAGDGRLVLPLAALLATSGGIRPNTPLFLLPLVVVACWRGWRRGVAPWRFGAGIALGLGLLAAWGGAFLAEVGGFERFWPLFQAWKGDHSGQSSTSGAWGNLWLLLRSIGLTAPAALALALLPPTGRRLRRSPPPRSVATDPVSSPPTPGPIAIAIATAPTTASERRWRGAFLGLWIAPSALYLVLVHFTRMGHATTLLPAVLLALAWRLDAARGGPTGASPSRSAGPLRWPRDLALVVALQCLLFLLVPGDRFAASLRDFDRDWGQAIAAVRRFDPATTLVITTGRSNLRAYRLPSVHFPAYDHDQADFRLDQAGPTIAVRPPLRRLVVLDRGLRLEPPALPGVRGVMLIPGRLRLLEVPIPASGLEVERGAVRPLPASTDG
ncbi:MAG: hypothetical protein VKO39_09315 [Cyanobacteriota bacterium]|nr:hypothetical protein [Cyanobacteriota bacterium]